MTIYEAIAPITNTVTALGLLFLIVVGAYAYTKIRKDYLQSKKISGLERSEADAAKGILFGKDWIGNTVYSPSKQEGHSLVCGGSGLGKTTALLIPTLRQWDGTFFSIDISGDISTHVQSDNTLVFSPCDPNTVPYNVFSVIDSCHSTHDQIEQLEKLAFLIMPDLPGSSDASIFFNTEGRKILTAALIAFYYAGIDFPEICQKIVGSSWKYLFREIDSQKNATASLYITSFRGTSEQNTSGCKQAADAAVKLFALNHNVSNAIRRPGGSERAFSPEILETTSVFFVLPDTVLDVYGPLLRIVTAQCLNYFAGRPIGASPPILFALDEFSSLGKIDIIGALQKFRKRNVRIMVLIQSLADLDRIYGKTERSAMMENFKYKVLLGAGDPDTQEYFAKLIGHEKQKKISTTSGSGSTSTTTSFERSWAIEPEELGTLGDDLILIHPAGHERLRKAFFFQQPESSIFNTFRHSSTFSKIEDFMQRIS